MNKRRIYLNNKIYSIDNVQKAIEDFHELIEGKIINDQIEIEIASNEDLDIIIDEFYNYVLGLMKAGVSEL